MRNGLSSRGIIYYAPTLIFLFLLSACSQKIADVEDIIITDRDMSFRKKVSEVYYPNSGKDYVALAHLINGYLSEKILNSIGPKIEDAILDAEAKRIDENTKAPETLKKIKDIYGKNRKAYIKTFVRVVYAERVLYNEVFLRSKEIHREEHQKAEEVLNKAIKSPGLFKSMAKEKRLKAVRLRVSLKDGIAPYEEGAKHKSNTGIGIEQAERLINTILKIKQGDVYPEVIEWVEGYQILRYIKKEKGNYIIDSVSIPKQNYDDWFWERAAKIPVRIYDKNLKDALLKEVSWARRLKLL